MANKIDANASSPNRIRRNFQRLAKTGIASGLTPGDTSLKLIGPNLAVNLDPAGDLYVGPAGVGVKLNPVGGLGMMITGGTAGTGLAVTGFQQLTSDPTGTDLKTAGSWFNTTGNQQKICFANDGTNASVGSYNGTIFSTAISGAITPNIATSIVPVYTGTFPANFLNVAGRQLLFVIKGFFNNGVANSFAVKPQINGCTLCTWTTPSTVGFVDFLLSIYATTVTTGTIGDLKSFTSTVVHGIGSDVGSAFDSVNNAPPNIDLTAANVWQFAVSPATPKATDGLVFTSGSIQLLF